MEAEWTESETFQASSKALRILMFLSVCWISIDGVLLVPIGALATLHYVGRNYETTFFASLRSGWRVLATSFAFTAVSWFAASLSLNIKLSGGAVGAGIGFELFRFLN